MRTFRKLLMEHDPYDKVHENIESVVIDNEGELKIVVNGAVLGHLDYSIEDNKIHVHKIETEKPELEKKLLSALKEIAKDQDFQIIREALVQLPPRVTEIGEKEIRAFMTRTFMFHCYMFEDKNPVFKEIADELKDQYKEYPYNLQDKGFWLSIKRQDLEELYPKFGKKEKWNKFSMRIRVRFVNEDYKIRGDNMNIVAGRFTQTTILLKIPLIFQSGYGRAFQAEFKNKSKKQAYQWLENEIQNVITTFKHELTHAMQSLGFDTDKYEKTEYLSKSIEFKPQLRGHYEDAVNFCKQKKIKFDNQSFKKYVRENTGGIFYHLRKVNPIKYQKAIKDLWTELRRNGWVNENV